jgi:hypothetical protein
VTNLGVTVEQGIAEQLSAAGVPVFVADMKGDVSASGRGRSGRAGGKASGRVGVPFTPSAFPVEYLGHRLPRRGKPFFLTENFERRQRCGRRVLIRGGR